MNERPPRIGRFPVVSPEARDAAGQLVNWQRVYSGALGDNLTLEGGQGIYRVKLANGLKVEKGGGISIDLSDPNWAEFINQSIAAQMSAGTLMGASQSYLFWVRVLNNGSVTLINQDLRGCGFTIRMSVAEEVVAVTRAQITEVALRQADGPAGPLNGPAIYVGDQIASDLRLSYVELDLNTQVNVQIDHNDGHVFFGYSSQAQHEYQSLVQILVWSKLTAPTHTL